MKRIGLLLLLVPVFSLAQKTGPEKMKTHVIASGGVSAGDSGVKPLFQLSAGATTSVYFAGVGVGYDRYRFNSIPVFADWRYNFGDKKVVFVYANGGYNVPGKYEKETEFSKTSDKMKGGLYVDAGFGYRFPVGKMHRISLSTGFNQKNMIRRVVYTYGCGTPGCDATETIYAYHYHFSRFVTKLSWEIGK